MSEPVEKPGQRRRLRSLLANRDYRNLLQALAVSALGDWLYAVALSVYIFDRTGSVAWVGAANIARLVPYALFGTLGGAVADRYDRRQVMITADLARAALMLALAVVAASGAPVGLALALAFLTTVASTAFKPALVTLTPAVVGEVDLAAANSLAETIENLALLVGPALGGALLVVAPPSVAIVLNSLTFMASAALVARVRRRGAAVTEERQAPLRERLGQGLRAITGSGDTALLVGLMVAATYVYGQELVLFVAVAEQRLGLGSEGLGWLLAGLGLGGLAAAPLIGRLADTSRPGAVLLAATLALGLPLASLALLRSAPVAVALLAVEGFGGIVFDVLTVTMLQRTVPRDVLGRVFGIMDSGAVTGIVLGTLVATTTVELLGLRWALLVAGATMPLVGLAALPRLRALSRSAERRRQELAGRVELLDRLRIFDGAPRTALESVAAALGVQPVRAGQVVISEGEEADHFYVVGAGDLEVRSAGERGGEPARLRTLSAGDWFGEIGLLERMPRSATVVATSDGTLYRIGGDDFLAAVGAAPTIPGVLRSSVRSGLARTHPSRTPTT
jgi:MFS family permease